MRGELGVLRRTVEGPQTTVTSRSTNTAFVTTQPTRFTPDTSYDIRVTSINLGWYRASTSHAAICQNALKMRLFYGTVDCAMCRKRGFLLSADTLNGRLANSLGAHTALRSYPFYTPTTTLVPPVVWRQVTISLLERRAEGRETELPEMPVHRLLKNNFRAGEQYPRSQLSAPPPNSLGISEVP